LTILKFLLNLSLCCMETWRYTPLYFKCRLPKNKLTSDLLQHCMGSEWLDLSIMVHTKVLSRAPNKALICPACSCTSICDSSLLYLTMPCSSLHFISHLWSL
jgi:hypothetical protein